MKKKLMHEHTENAQTSLRNNADWSEHSLYALSIVRSREHTSVLVAKLSMRM